MLERFDKQYSVNEVLDFVRTNVDTRDRKKRVEFDGHMMKPHSVRYLTFINTGTKCISCEHDGIVFYKERTMPSDNPNPKTPYHFNLYSMGEGGTEVLMTKDHIIPKSQGGSDGVLNMTTMCTLCNIDKGAVSPKTWGEDHNVDMGKGVKNDTIKPYKRKKKKKKL